MKEDSSCNEAYSVRGEAGVNTGERQSKRYRKGESSQKRQQVTELGSGAPQGQSPTATALRSLLHSWEGKNREGRPPAKTESKPQAPVEGENGEQEAPLGAVEAPPRWTNARRRSSLRLAPERHLPYLPDLSQSMIPGHHDVEWERPQRRSKEGGELLGNRDMDMQTSLHGWVPMPSPSVPAASTSSLAPEARYEASGRLSHADLSLAEARTRDSLARNAELSKATRDLHRQAIESRMDELEEMEAMEELLNRQGIGSGVHKRSERRQRQEASNCRHSTQQPGACTPSASLADAMMGMLAEGGPLTQMQLGPLNEHVAAVRLALGHMAGPSRLPPHLLFTDRDFDENDYEALLALDETVKSRKGASQKEIEKIPTIVIGAASKWATETRCPICLEDLLPGALLRRMACKHFFHQSCLDRWLSHRASCPICLQSLHEA